MTGRLILFLKEKVDYIVAVVIMFDGISIIIAFANHQLSGTSSFFDSHILYILTGLSTASLLSLLVLFLLLLSKKKSVASLSRDLDNNHSIIKDLRDFKARFHKCEQSYRTLARKNASCDWELFTTLFSNHIKNSPQLQASVISAIAVTNTNITDILDTAAKVFSEHTGDKCSACVQIFNPSNSTVIEDGSIKTIARDSDSMTSRALQGGEHFIRRNTIHRWVYVEGRDPVVSDDLMSAISKGEIQTSSSLDGSYNAVFVTVIPNMPPSFDRHMPRATLCIDNNIGGFDGELFMHISKELAWRLGVMLYRLTELEKVRDHS